MQSLRNREKDVGNGGSKNGTRNVRSKDGNEEGFAILEIMSVTEVHVWSRLNAGCRSGQ